MYKIVIADDEPFIIKGLRIMVDYSSLGAEIVGEAQNGRQLLELIESCLPDIVISDIEMPELKGLDVLRIINEKQLKTKILFLTAFQEFSYAKDAVTYGAVDYLVKPVSKEEITEGIKRAICMIEKERAFINLTEDLKEEKESIHERKEEISFSSVIEKLTKKEIKYQNQVYAGVCITLSEESKKIVSNHDKFELLRFAIFKSLQDYMEAEKLGTFIKRNDKYSNAVFVLPKENTRNFLEEKLQKLRDWVFSQYEAKINVGIGDFSEDLQKINYIYKTAKFSLELYYFKQEETIFYQNISREYHQSLEDLEKLSKVFFESVINREHKWKKECKNCFDMIENIHYGNRYAAENRCSVLLTDLYRYLKEFGMLSEEIEKEFEVVVQNIRFVTSFAQLKKYVFRMLDTLLERIYASPENNEAFVIGQVKHYIREHFAEEITLEQMSGKVYMNPSYFSSFFKKQTGQNFKKYLVEIRMQEAKKLLLDGELKTYEIAEAVGYKDIRSFTDKFKEVYGETPAIFKKN